MHTCLLYKYTNYLIFVERFYQWIFKLSLWPIVILLVDLFYISPTMGIACCCCCCINFKLRCQCHAHFTILIYRNHFYLRLTKFTKLFNELNGKCYVTLPSEFYDFQRGPKSHNNNSDSTFNWYVAIRFQSSILWILLTWFCHAEIQFTTTDACQPCIINTY